MKDILVILPSLNRPTALVAALDSLIRCGTGLADILILGGNTGGGIATMNGVPKELIGQYKVIGLFGDDGRMRTPKWDELVMAKLNGKVGLIYGRDGIQDRNLCTHPFFSSEIPLRLGFLQPPCCHHYYGDNFFMDLLRPLGKVQYVPELFTEHLHPSQGKGPDDATYSNAAQWNQHDSIAYPKYRDGEMNEDRKKLIGL